MLLGQFGKLLGSWRSGALDHLKKMHMDRRVCGVVGDRLFSYLGLGSDLFWVVLTLNPELVVL